MLWHTVSAVFWPFPRFSDAERALLEHAFLLREGQTEEQRAAMRAEFELKWPALVAYIKQAEARGENMSGDVLFALGECQEGPSLQMIVWYMLDRAVVTSNGKVQTLPTSGLS